VVLVEALHQLHQIQGNLLVGGRVVG